MKQAML
jgi:hypothetical protein